MRPSPTPRPSDDTDSAAARPASPSRLVPPQGGIRVLQNRRAPAQLSLFQRALPAR